MDLVLIDPRGEVIFRPNSTCREPWSREQPGSAESYLDFFYRIPRIHCGLSGIELITDPLGLQLALTRLEGGCFLLMKGLSSGEDPPGRSPRPGTLLAVEGGDLEYIHPRLPALEPEEMKENLGNIAWLFNKLYRYFARPNLPTLLSVFEKLEQLLFSSCDPNQLDAKAFLELITAALVLVAGGGSAFAFSYECPGRMMALGCGERPGMVQALSEEWNRLGREQDPGKRFAALISERAKDESTTTIKGVLYQNNGISVYLGLIGTGGFYLQEALQALARKAAAALGIASIWTEFQGSWKMVFNSISQGIIVVDNRGVIMIMNKAAKDLCRERRIAPAMGRPVKGCRLGTQIEEALSSAAENGSSFKQKCSLIDEGLSPRHLRWDVVPLLRDDGQNSGAVLVFEDITATVLLQDEIRNWERLATAGELAASLAHEVRNPLATAKAAIHLLRMDDTMLKREELLEKLDRELDRTNNILTNFLNISRPIQEERLEPICLWETLQELLFFLKGEALLHEIDLVTVLPEENVPAVLGSSNSIKQVCLNIALNAIEAMSGGGRLTISLLLQGEDRVHLRFEDTGQGISAENLEVLTRPFFTTKPGGTGLGLAISAAILEAMGGELKIESRPGKGTTVELILPVFVD